MQLCIAFLRNFSVAKILMNFYTIQSSQNFLSFSSGFSLKRQIQMIKMRLPYKLSRYFQLVMIFLKTTNQILIKIVYILLQLCIEQTCLLFKVCGMVTFRKLHYDHTAASSLYIKNKIKIIGLN